MSSRIAAIVPIAGSFIRGFRIAPPTGIAVMDVHGSSDSTVPANYSLSSLGQYYTLVSDIFNGNATAPGWIISNGCTGTPSHYPTSYDGISGLYCVQQGSCTAGIVVNCSWNGGHNWYGNSSTNGGLVTEFLLKWAKTIPSSRRLAATAGPLPKVEILDVQDPPTLEAKAGRRLPQRRASKAPTTASQHSAAARMRRCSPSPMGRFALRDLHPPRLWQQAGVTHRSRAVLLGASSQMGCRLTTAARPSSTPAHSRQRHCVGLLGFADGLGVNLKYR